MKIALYGDNKAELSELTGYLKQCGREQFRLVDVTAFTEQRSFWEAIRKEEAKFELIVVVQDGTFSLEIMDMIKASGCTAAVFWFSDLDFAVRSYEYGTLWFGRKPVQSEDIRKAFRRISVRK